MIQQALRLLFLRFLIFQKSTGNQIFIETFDGSLKNNWEINNRIQIVDAININYHNPSNGIEKLVTFASSPSSRADQQISLKSKPLTGCVGFKCIIQFNYIFIQNFTFIQLTNYTDDKLLTHPNSNRLFFFTNLQQVQISFKQNLTDEVELTLSIVDSTVQISYQENQCFLQFNDRGSDNFEQICIYLYASSIQVVIRQQLQQCQLVNSKFTYFKFSQADGLKYIRNQSQPTAPPIKVYFNQVGDQNIFSVSPCYNMMSVFVYKSEAEFTIAPKLIIQQLLLDQIVYFDTIMVNTTQQDQYTQWILTSLADYVVNIENITCQQSPIQCNIQLNIQRGYEGFALNDIYINITNIIGSNHRNDYLFGNEKNNIIYCPGIQCNVRGYRGNDMISGIGWLRIQNDQDDYAIKVNLGDSTYLIEELKELDFIYNANFIEDTMKNDIFILNSNTQTYIYSKGGSDFISGLSYNLHKVIFSQRNRSMNCEYSYFEGHCSFSDPNEVVELKNISGIELTKFNDTMKCSERDRSLTIYTQCLTNIHIQGCGLTEIANLYTPATILLNESKIICPKNVNITIDNFIDILGSNFDDILIGDEQNNRIRPVGGNDFIDGREGSNTLYYGADSSYFEQGTITYLRNQTLVKVFNGQVDKFINIQNILLTAYNDKVYYFGEFDVDGHTGVNFIDFTDLESSIQLNLGLNSLKIKDQSINQTIKRFTQIRGSHYQDTIVAQTQTAIEIFVSDGNDTYSGSSTYNDTLNYKDGLFSITFKQSQGIVQYGNFSQVIFGFENLVGSMFNDLVYLDTIKGDQTYIRSIDLLGGSNKIYISNEQQYTITHNLLGETYIELDDNLTSCNLIIQTQTLEKLKISYINYYTKLRCKNCSYSFSFENDFGGYKIMLIVLDLSNNLAIMNTQISFPRYLVNDLDFLQVLQLCPDENYFIDQQENPLVLTCRKCSRKCLTCIEQNYHCLTCSEGREVAPKCVCSFGSFDGQDVQCATCPKQCKQCRKYEYNICEKCDFYLSRVLKDNQCVCLDEYYQDSKDLACQRCSKWCKTCDDYQSCTSCDETINSILQEKQCKCKPGYYRSFEQMECLKETQFSQTTDLTQTPEGIILLNVRFDVAISEQSQQHVKSKGNLTLTQRTKAEVTYTQVTQMLKDNRTFQYSITVNQSYQLVYLTLSFDNVSISGEDNRWIYKQTQAIDYTFEIILDPKLLSENFKNPFLKTINQLSNQTTISYPYLLVNILALFSWLDATMQPIGLLVFLNFFQNHQTYIFQRQVSSFVLPVSAQEWQSQGQMIQKEWHYFGQNLTDDVQQTYHNLQYMQSLPNQFIISAYPCLIIISAAIFINIIVYLYEMYRNYAPQTSQFDYDLEEVSISDLSWFQFHSKVYQLYQIKDDYAFRLKNYLNYYIDSQASFLYTSIILTLAYPALTSGLLVTSTLLCYIFTFTLFMLVVIDIGSIMYYNTLRKQANKQECYINILQNSNRRSDLIEDVQIVNLYHRNILSFYFKNKNLKNTLIIYSRIFTNLKKLLFSLIIVLLQEYGTFQLIFLIVTQSIFLIFKVFTFGYNGILRNLMKILEDQLYLVVLVLSLIAQIKITEIQQSPLNKQNEFIMWNEKGWIIFSLEFILFIISRIMLCVELIVRIYAYCKEKGCIKKLEEILHESN